MPVAVRVARGVAKVAYDRLAVPNAKFGGVSPQPLTGPHVSSGPWGEI
jgi:hypothetical protein